MFKKIILKALAAMFCIVIMALPVGAWVICTDVGVNNELIDNNTDDMIDFAGRGGADNTDIRFDLDGTSPTISSPTDGVITIAEALSIGGALYPTSADGGALGSATLEWSDLFMADASIIYLGADQDVTLTHVADTGVLLNSTMAIQFGDSSTYINQASNGYLSFVADTGWTFYDAVNGGDPAIYFGSAAAEALIITADFGAGDQLLDKVTFATATSQAVADDGKFVFNVDGTDICQIDDGGINPAAANTQTLGDAALEWGDLFLGDSGVIYFQSDQSVYLTSSALTLTLTGTLATTAGVTVGTSLLPDAADDAVIGSATAEWSDLFLADGAVINLGADQDVTLTHVADTGVQINAAMKVLFRDTAIHIASANDGYLDITADVAIRLNGAVVHSNETVTCVANAGVASLTKTLSMIVTDGGADANDDTITLADGVAGQIKVFLYKTETDAGDTANITPAHFAGAAGTKITFDVAGEGCEMIFDGTNWSVIANNGGTIG